MRLGNSVGGCFRGWSGKSLSEVTRNLILQDAREPNM